MYLKRFVINFNFTNFRDFLFSKNYINIYLRLILKTVKRKLNYVLYYYNSHVLFYTHGIPCSIIKYTCEF